MKWLPKFTLSQRLLVLLAGTLLTLQLVGIALDRYQHINSSYQNLYSSGPRSLVQRVRILSRFAPEERPALARNLSAALQQYFVRSVPGLHPDDVRDTDFEQRALELLRRERIPVAEILIATRSFHPLPAQRPRGIDPREPRIMALGDQPRASFLMPQGFVPVWVTGDWANHDTTGQSDRLSDPETGPPRDQNPPRGARPPRDGISVDVATFALRLEGQEEWITLYLLLRPPRVNVQVTKLIFSSIATVLIAGIVIVIGRSNTRPMHDMRKSAAILSRGERAPDVRMRGAKDIQEIVGAFNAMNARVSQATDYQIGLLRSLGHDLKGPLAAVARLVENVGPDETREQIEARLGSAQNIVDSIMSFSRAVMRDGELQTVDLSSVLQSVIDEQADMGADATVETPGRFPVVCRVNATERCLRNLVENALKYGGNAQARLLSIGDEAVIQIDDDGPGIPEHTLEQVFQPFYRLSEDAQGSGLGLAIARTIAIDQGGSLTLSNRAESGLRAELRLPLPE